MVMMMVMVTVMVTVMLAVMLRVRVVAKSVCPDPMSVFDPMLDTSVFGFDPITHVSFGLTPSLIKSPPSKTFQHVEVSIA